MGERHHRYVRYELQQQQQVKWQRTTIDFSKTFGQRRPEDDNALRRRTLKRFTIKNYSIAENRILTEISDKRDLGTGITNRLTNET